MSKHQMIAQLKVEGGTQFICPECSRRVWLTPDSMTVMVAGDVEADHSGFVASNDLKVEGSGEVGL